MGALFGKLKTLFTKKQIELCLVGLENSGKTTLLNVLSMGHAVDTLPTVGLTVKMMKKDGVSMKVWDLGGQERYRVEWPRYTAGCDVILFVVDAAAPDRIDTARQELHRLLEDRNLFGHPLLIVLNKIDLEPRLTREQAINKLNMEYITDNEWLIVEISALKTVGVEKIVDWLVKNSHS